MSDYEKLYETLSELVGQNIVIVDKRGREKVAHLIEVWDNTIKVEHKTGMICHYPLTGEYDFKPFKYGLDTNA
jgi:hypothetical protein